MAVKMAVLLVLIIALLPSAIIANCPDNCQCLPGFTKVSCKGTFDRLPAISPLTVELDMSNCRFVSPVLQRSNFSGLENLEQLILRGCDISTIEYNTFADMTKLTMLDLSLNNLAVMAENSLAGLRLEYLYLDNNPMMVLPDSAFSGMTTEVLSMKSCALTEVKPALFTPLLGSLRKIFLEGNSIERFSTEMLNVFTSVDAVRIFGNPLICDCQSRWLKQFYDLNKNTTKITDASQGITQEPRCASPTHLSGQFFNRITIADFSCDKPTLHAGISFTKEKGTLTCVSRGSPLPTVSWYRPNGVVSHTQPQGNMVSNTNEIELLAGEPNVQGQYRCVASNNGGNISLTVNVEWPFEETDDSTNKASPCVPAALQTTPKEVHLSNKESEVDNSNQTDVFKAKYFTLVDLVGAILGTFVCTLIVTVLLLHFCVYRRKTASQYATPSVSEYSNSSNNSDKSCTYPTHAMQQPMMLAQRPLPTKPYHKMYDENHYMATNIEERDEFLRHSTMHALHNNGRITPCDTCPACRTLSNSHIS